MTWYVGDTATITFSTSLAGVAADMITITVFTRSPSGTITTPTPTHAGTGSYTIPLTPTEPGQWTVGGTAIYGASQKSETAKFTVVVTSSP